MLICPVCEKKIHEFANTRYVAIDGRQQKLHRECADTGSLPGTSPPMSEQLEWEAKRGSRGQDVEPPPETELEFE